MSSNYSVKFVVLAFQKFVRGTNCMNSVYVNLLLSQVLIVQKHQQLHFYRNYSQYSQEEGISN